MGLLIASRFRRPNAPIDLPNEDGTFKTYFFRPLDAKNASSEHVALVEDPAHISRLLAIPEGYYLAEDASARLKAADDAAGEMQKPGGPGTPPPADGATPPATGEAADLLALNLPEFKKAIAAADHDLLVQAQAIEQAKEPADQRPTYLKALAGAIK